MIESTIIDPPCGKLRGTREKSVEGFEIYAFRGIPYAKPPVEKLRFQVTKFIIYI